MDDVEKLKAKVRELDDELYRVKDLLQDMRNALGAVAKATVGALE